MKVFEDFQQEWQLHGNEAPHGAVIKKTTWREQLTTQMFWSGSGLIALSFVLIYTGIINSKPELTIIRAVSVALAAVTVLVAGIVNWNNYYKLRRVSETDSPSRHLAFWRDYYASRVRFVRRAGPSFFFVINLAFALQLPRVLVSYPSLTYKMAFCTLYVALMTYLWFSIGRKMWNREQERCRAIVMGYERMLGQLTN